MDPMAVWRFWFEEGPKERWFRKDPEFDAEIGRRFADLPEAALRGELDSWWETPRGALALVLVLDQFPRNLFRGEDRAFRYDAAARAVADRVVKAGLDSALTLDERVFLYLPFEHSEALADQDRAIELFTALGDANYLRYAHAHRDIVVRFGRFPHRNAALGRPSTPEEAEFLTQPGSSF
jgi:uncharacterized protein (DUF924 family)